MGYSIGNCSKHKRFVGYAMHAYCDHPGCKAEIDRGMAYLCCGHPDHTASCGGFYCEDHREHYVFEDELKDLSDEELKQYGISSRNERAHDADDGIICCKHLPVDRDKEHPTWLKHVLKDESWQQWRDENHEEVKRYQTLLADSKSKYARLNRLINEAKAKGREAANLVDDGGTANLDKVVISGLKGVRESTLKKAGIHCYKHWSFAGSFILSGSFGQGNKNTVGVQAMKDYLKSNGVDCYIHYQMD